MAYFAAKADQLYSIDVYWIVVVQGSYAKSTLWEALRKVPTDIGGSLRDVWHSFPATSSARFFVPNIERDHLLLRQKVSGLIGQLSDLSRSSCKGRRSLPHTAALHQFRPLQNSLLPPRGSRYLDFQLCDSELEAHRGHLRSTTTTSRCSR